MNRKQHIAPSGTIRFRRWSRKNYAVFASLGRCVTIGHVCKGITERALAKQGIPDISLYTEQLKPESDDDPPDKPKTALELLLAVIVPQITTTRPASGEYPYINSTNCVGGALNAFCYSTTTSCRTHSTRFCLYFHTP